MKEIRYRMNLDVQQGGIQQTLAGFRVGDTLSRTVCIHLVERGAAYQIPAGCVVTLYAKKPDGTVSYSTCTVENGSLQHTFTSGELAVPGEMLCEVRIVSGNENPVVLSSPQFGVIVEDILQEDGAIESTSEYTALTEMLAGLDAKKTEAGEAASAARTAADKASAAANVADEAADSAMTASLSANVAAAEVKKQVADKTTTYILQWSDNINEDRREENEPVLEKLSKVEDGRYHVVLRDGGHEYPLNRREYTAEDGYFYYFGGEMHETYAAAEYVVQYKPANKLEVAEYNLTRRSVVNSQRLEEFDFRPPTTDLVKIYLEDHAKNTDIHVTAAEKAKWNAGTGGGDSVTYTLSKTGNTIKLTGSDGSSSTVTDSNTTYGNASAAASGLMSGADKTKLDGLEAGANKYVHPTYTAKVSGLYKVTVDGTGHVSAAVPAAKGDITALGIPGQDTIYTEATGSSAGLMSAADKAKLDGIADSADSVTFESARTNGTEVGTININGTETKLWAPMNTHYSSSSIVGTSATAKINGAASNGSVYLNHIEDSTVKSAHKITGSGATTVTSDSSGNITVYSANTTYTEATSSKAGLMSAADKAKLDGYSPAVFEPMVTVNAYKLNTNGAAADKVVEDIYFDETEGFLHLYEGTGIRLTGYTPAGAVPQRKGIKLELNMEEIIAAFPDASEVSY